MPTTPTPSTPPVDPVAAANSLANSYYSLSRQLNQYRLNPPQPLSDADAATLKQQAIDLDHQAHLFTAAAMAATLASIAPDLNEIETVTSTAKDQLGHLTDVGKVINLATLSLGLGTALAGGNISTILGATQALLTALPS